VHKFALTFAATALFALPASVFSQTFEIGPGGVQIDPGDGYHHRHHGYEYSRGYGGQCRELRLACLHKEELGEQGQGNCERYRSICGR
jgi:hypothetical protein